MEICQDICENKYLEQFELTKKSRLTIFAHYTAVSAVTSSPQTNKHN